MMSTIEGLGAGVVVVEAHGRLTGSDYENVLIPALERAHAAHRKIRLLYQVAPDFDGLTVPALWEDARVGIRFMTAFERVAVVTDVSWIVAAVNHFRFLIPAETKTFKNEEIEAAKSWLQSPST